MGGSQALVGGEREKIEFSWAKDSCPPLIEPLGRPRLWPGPELPPRANSAEGAAAARRSAAPSTAAARGPGPASHVSGSSARPAAQQAGQALCGLAALGQTKIRDFVTDSATQALHVRRLQRLARHGRVPRLDAGRSSSSRRAGSSRKLARARAPSYVRQAACLARKRSLRASAINIECIVATGSRQGLPSPRVGSSTCR